MHHKISSSSHVLILVSWVCVNTAGLQFKYCVSLCVGIVGQTDDPCQVSM